MAGRNRLPPHAFQFRESPLEREFIARRRDLIEESRMHLQHPHPDVIEERLAIQHREFQDLLQDNQHLAATHIALKQELAAAQKDIHHLSVTAKNVKLERDVQVRGVYERSLKLEAEVRGLDALSAELVQVRTDIQKLIASNRELESQLQALNGDLKGAREDLKQVPSLKAEIESMHQELQRGRAAIEYEKKAYADNLEQSMGMEKNMISMAHEVEKLRAELANAEKRARAAAAANPVSGYSGSYAKPEMGYGGNSYSDVYGIHQIPGSGADGGSHYHTGSARVPYDYEKQRGHVHR